MLALKIGLFILLVLGSVFPIYGRQGPFMEWKNCVHYFIHFPDYKRYEPPQDILKEGCPWGNWVTFPQKTCDAIQQEYIAYDPYDISQDVSQSSSYIPEFLMLVDHPSHYLISCNYAIFDQPECQLLVDRFWAIFMMHQLGAFQGDTLKYDELIRSAYDYYYFSPDSGKGMSLLLMESLLLCKTLGYFKYPLFIIHYKDKAIQKALHRFIALLTIPCGLKEIAKKILAGKLATSQEMEYMHGYIAFRKKYFTLYETLLPSP